MVKDFVHQSSYDHSWSSCVRAYFLRYPNPNAAHVLSVDVIDRHIEYRPVRNGSSSAASTSSVTLDDLDHSSSQRTIPVLCTTRLILKRGNLPRWAPAGLMKNAESWVMEESEVELDLFPPRTTSTPPSDQSEGLATAAQAKSLKGRTKNGRAMRSWTRNLDHTTVMAVTEGLVFKERFGFMSPNEGRDSDNGHNKNTGTETAIWRSYCKTLTTAQIESQVSFGMLRRRIEKFGLARFVAHKDTSQQGIMWTRSQLGDGEAGEDPSSKEQSLLQRTSMPQKRIKILESLRPPFLDGYPLGPWQKIKMWWYSGHYSQVKELRDGYLIERDEDDDESDASNKAGRRAGDGPGSSQGRSGEALRFRGAEQEGPWAELSGRKGKGAVYSDQDRNMEEGVLNRVRTRFGLPLVQPPRASEEGQGVIAKAVARMKTKAKSMLGFDDEEIHAKQQTQGRLERIDRDRAV